MGAKISNCEMDAPTIPAQTADAMPTLLWHECKTYPLLEGCDTGGAKVAKKRKKKKKKNQQSQQPPPAAEAEAESSSPQIGGNDSHLRSLISSVFECAGRLHKLQSEAAAAAAAAPAAPAAEAQQRQPHAPCWTPI